MEVTLDFSSALNIKVLTNPESVVIEPFTTRIVAIVRAYDIQWTTQVNVRVVKRPVQSKDT